MDIKLYINNDKLSCPNFFTVYTGNVGTYRCVFVIKSALTDASWFCVFKQGEKVYSTVIEGNACVIPHEVLESNVPLYIGCYGVSSAESEHKRISTNWITAHIENGAYSEATAPETPSLDVWETLVSKTVPIIGENDNWFIYDITQKKYIDSGCVARGKDGYTPQKGVDYWTEDDKAEFVGDVKDELDFDERLGNKQDRLTDEQLSDINKIPNIETTANDALECANSVSEGLSDCVTTAEAESTYAKKTDISSVYKYQGSVSDANSLSYTGSITSPEIGDVYNCVGGGTAYTRGSSSGIKISYVDQTPSGEGYAVRFKCNDKSVELPKGVIVEIYVDGKPQQYEIVKVGYTQRIMPVSDTGYTPLEYGSEYDISVLQYTINEGANVAWNGYMWDDLGGTFDLSGYQTKLTDTQLTNIDKIPEIKTRVDDAYPEYDFDETYVITEDEATANEWKRTADSEGNPIRLSEMQVDFTIPAGENTGVQYLYFQYENTEKPASPRSMRVTEFSYQNTSKERHIRVVCYKERETFYSIRGYMWDDDSNYTMMNSTSGYRMSIGNFFENPAPLKGVYFNVANGLPAAGTVVRIRGKRINEN